MSVQNRSINACTGILRAEGFEIAENAETVGNNRLWVGPSSTLMFTDGLGVDHKVTNAPAGGDLAGTFPNPSVNALTMTGGSYTLGSVDDGKFIKRMGTTLQGENAGPGSYEAIVDIGGSGDYTSIGAAIADGKTRIFVRAGIYVEMSTISIPIFGLLVGEAGVVIVMGPGARIEMDGSGGVQETAGTLSITSNTQTVTGSGTTFTNIIPGWYILLDAEFYEVLSVETDTSLTIKSVYRGRSLSGQDYIAHNMVAGIQISNIIIVASDREALYVRAARNCFVIAMAFFGGICNLCLENCGSISVFSFAGQDSLNNGIDINNVYSSSFNAVNVFNSTACGFSITGNTRSLIFDSVLCNNNGSHGISISGNVSLINLDNCIVTRNVGDGIISHPSIGTAIMIGCTVSNNLGDGIDFDGTNNQVIGCNVRGNGGFGIEAGNDGLVQGNHVDNNGDVGISLKSDNGVTVTGNVVTNNASHGIHVTQDDNALNGNRVDGNTGAGILVATSVKDITVCGNVCKNNSGAGIDMDGDDCIVNGNRCSGNTGEGIIVGTTSARCLVTSNNVRGNTGTNLVVNSGTAVQDNNIV